jgi:uncharacterized membrane protein YphA (DoxX/SURF4 family)
MEAVALGAELLIGTFLLVAGIAKLRAGKSRVVAAVARYEIGSVEQQRLLARLLPWLEISLGVGLILGFSRDLAALGAGGLLAAFAAAIARSLTNGAMHPCGCGAGRVQTLISWTLVMRNGVLVAALTAAELARNAPATWSPTNFALAAVLLTSTLSSAALYLRSRTPITRAHPVAPTTSRT